MTETEIQSRNKFLHNKYMDNLASIPAKVINKHHMQTELIEWENLYFIENNFKSTTVSDIKLSVKAGADE